MRSRSGLYVPGSTFSVMIPSISSDPVVSPVCDESSQAVRLGFVLTYHRRHPSGPREPLGEQVFCSQKRGSVELPPLPIRSPTDVLDAANDSYVLTARSTFAKRSDST